MTIDQKELGEGGQPKLMRFSKGPALEVLSMLSWKTRKTRKTQSDWPKKLCLYGRLLRFESIWYTGLIYRARHTNNVLKKSREYLGMLREDLYLNSGLKTDLESKFAVVTSELLSVWCARIWCLLEVFRHLWGDFPQLWARVGCPQGLYDFVSGEYFLIYIFYIDEHLWKSIMYIQYLQFSISSIYHSTERVFRDVISWLSCLDSNSGRRKELYEKHRGSPLFVRNMPPVAGFHLNVKRFCWTGTAEPKLTLRQHHVVARVPRQADT